MTELKKVDAETGKVVPADTPANTGDTAAASTGSRESVADAKSDTKTYEPSTPPAPQARSEVAAAVAAASPQGQFEAKLDESRRLNPTAAAPTIEVPEGRERPATLSETMAERDKVSEEARTDPDRPTVTGAILPPDTGVPTTRLTTTNPEMGVPDNTKFTTPKAAEKAKAKK